MSITPKLQTVRDIFDGDGNPATDLSKRMADNVAQALLGYMQTETALGAERVHAYSTALSSLSLLAIAEQLQRLAGALIVDEEPEPDADAEIAGLRSQLAQMDADNAALTAALFNKEIAL